MSDPAAVGVAPGDLPRLLVGLALWLLPGVAAADRWMAGRLRHLWAPLWSVSLLALWAIALDFTVALAITARNTALLAVLLAAWIGRARIRQAVAAGMAWARGAPRADRAPRPSRGPFLSRVPWARLAWGAGIAATLLFVAVVHYVPHVPADGEEPAFPYEALAYRAWDMAHGRDDPYPLHADEHNHMAHMAEVERQARTDVADPFTGEPAEGSLLSVAGLRKDRGFDLAIVQLHMLTDASLPALHRALPALWSAFTALTVYLALRPASGALASAAFVAALHTTDRFLGPAFLVPSAFGLPWILAMLDVSLRMAGPARLAGLGWLGTGAFALHLVPATLGVMAGLLASLLGQGTPRARAARAAAVLLPLAWIVPLAYGDIEQAVAGEHELPFSTGYFRVLGWLLPALAVAGAGIAWHRKGTLRPETAPHRVLALLAVGMAFSMVLSVQSDHRNDATYSRLVHAFFLSLGALAGLAAATLAGWATRQAARRLRHPRATAVRPVAAGLVTLGVVAAGLATPITAHLEEPLYRVFDDDSWDQGRAFARLRPTDGTFLADPWKAPVYTAMSGQKPWAYLIPGTAAVNGEDVSYYLRSEGANATWLEERGIRAVLLPVPPAAPHREPHPDVYALRPR